MAKFCCTRAELFAITGEAGEALGLGNLDGVKDGMPLLVLIRREGCGAGTGHRFQWGVAKLVKARGFDPRIPRFESWHPSQCTNRGD